MRKWERRRGFTDRWTWCTVTWMFYLFVGAQVHAASPTTLLQSKPLQVFVSVPAQKDIVKRIGGEHVRVKTLTQAGKSPCHYEPTPIQIRELTQAQIYFVLGVPFEQKLVQNLRELAPNLPVVDTQAGMVSRAARPQSGSIQPGLTFQVHSHDANSMKQSLGNTSSPPQPMQAPLGLGVRRQKASKVGASGANNSPSIDLFKVGGASQKSLKGKSLNPEETLVRRDSLHCHCHDHDAQNDKKGEQNALSLPSPQSTQKNKKGHSPQHVWLDPYLVLGQTRVIYDSLVALDPHHSHVYKANWEKLSRELAALDKRVAQMLQPVRGKAFLVFHPAWECFAHAYGLKQIAVPTGKGTLSAKQLTRAIEQARLDNVCVIIIHSSDERKYAKVLKGVLDVPVVLINLADFQLGSDYVGGLQKLAKKMKAVLSGRHSG